MIKVRDVNLKKVSLGFESKAKPDSVYRRIQRFFSEFEVDSDLVAKFVISKLPPGPYTLSMDRTNWKFGKANINILTVGIVYKKIAFPVAWILLDKQGNSNTNERIRVMEKILKLIPNHQIEHLLADREFIGKKWFLWLKQKKISFVIRIKENFQIVRRGKKRSIKTSFRCLKEMRAISIKDPLEICGVRLFVTGTRVDGEYCIVVSDFSKANTIEIYLRRWAIETFFGCIKSRGFEMENTHMTDPERISKLLALIVIAFTWAHLVGEFLNEITPIKIKKHGRKSISIFRFGLDFIQHSLLNFSIKYHDFITSIRCLL